METHLVRACLGLASFSPVVGAAQTDDPGPVKPPATAAVADKAEPEGDIELVVHHLSGLSSGSTTDRAPEVILFKAHTHFHLKLRNSSGRSLNLWRPNCPEGDLAFGIEFRLPGDEEKKIYRSGTVRNYTGGMGIPKSLTLAAKNDLIIDVDFINGGWSFPLEFKRGEIKELEMRAVYDPAPYSGDRPDLYAHLEPIWVGRATSPWERVRVINRTGKPFGPFPPYIRPAEQAGADVEREAALVYTSGANKDVALPIGVAGEAEMGRLLRIYVGESVHPAVHRYASSYNRAVVRSLSERVEAP